MKKEIYIIYYESIAGFLLLGEFEGKLCLCDWKSRRNKASIEQRLRKYLKADFLEKTTPFLEETAKVLDAYFNGEKRRFDLPLLCVGSTFQQKIWDAVSSISYGETLSYKALAAKSGNEKAVRAAATAVGANALSIFIPCHRVVGSDGSLHGYAGGLDAKKVLLEHEGVTVC